MSYRDKCEQLYLENQELKERFKEAKKEIDAYESALRMLNFCCEASK